MLFQFQNKVFKFRDAISSDSNAVAEIYNYSIPVGKATADLEEKPISYFVTLISEHKPATNPFWVIVNDLDLVVGYISFKNFYPRQAYKHVFEISLYLHPNYQGFGLGKIALKQAHIASPSLGITILLAYIFGHNINSLALFQSLGYEPWGLLPKIANMPEAKRDLIILGINLI